MQITSVEIKLANSPDRLRAFASFVIDECFVVRDVKILDGPQGLFVAMPSRKKTTACGYCNHKNVVQSKYCNHCGHKMAVYDPIPGENPHVDVAHPINQAGRQIIAAAVLKAYEEVAGKVGV